MNDADKLSTLKQLVGDKPAYTLFDLIQRDGLSTLTELKENLSDVNGVTAEMANIQNTTLASSMKRLANAINTINIIIGKLFAPTVNAIAGKLAGLAAILADLASSPIGQLILKLTAGMALGVLAVGGLAAVIAAVSVALPALMGGLSALGAAVAAIAWPFTIVAVAIAVFTYAWKKNLGGIADFFKDKFNKINLVIRGVVAVFTTLKDGVGEVRGALAEDIQAKGLVGAVTLIGKVFYRVYQIASGFFTGFGEAISAVVSSLAPVVNLAKAISAPVGDLLGLFGKIISKLAGASAATDSSGWKTFGKIIAISVTAPFRVLAFVIGKVAAVLTVVVKVITYPFRTLIALTGKVIDAFGHVYRFVKKVFSGAGESASGFGKIISKIFGIIKLAFKLFGAVIGGIKGIFNGIGSIAGKIFGGIGKAATVVKDTIGNAFSTVGGFAKKAFGGIGNAASAIFSGVTGIADKIAGFFNMDLSESGKKLLETFTSGVKSVVTAPFDAVKGGLAKLRNLLPFSDAKEGPLSALTLSGTKMMSTLGEGIAKGAPELYSAANDVFEGLPVPDISMPEESCKQSSNTPERTMNKSNPNKGLGNTIINIKNITLPAVKSAEDFISALEKIALQGGTL